MTSHNPNLPDSAAREFHHELIGAALFMGAVIGAIFFLMVK